MPRRKAHRVRVTRTLVFTATYLVYSSSEAAALGKAVIRDQLAPLDSGKVTHVERSAIFAPPAALPQSLPRQDTEEP